ncbi:MAG TPA: DUF2922 domain-containing protein [Pseudogracilibacillus sp.]|nr:DUF2922 domain-containing protein [Pseudogracilibacillus sp.]
MKKLELQFLTEEGKTATFSVDEPIEPANPETVVAVMDEVLEQDVFESKTGKIVAKKGARIVERIVTEIDIDME